MSPADTIEVLKPLGITAPLVVVLIWLLRDAHEERRQAQDERQTITERFLMTMQTTVIEGAKAQTAAAAALQDLASAMREGQSRSTDEHNRIVDALGKFGSRERAA